MHRCCFTLVRLQLNAAILNIYLGCWAPPGIGRVTHSKGEAAPPAPSSWVRSNASCEASRLDSAPPGTPLPYVSCYILLHVLLLQLRCCRRLQVPTIDGSVELTVPQLTLNGEVLRMRGKGIADPRGRGRGDQLVNIRWAVSC
jgi:hypothetical protein